MVTILKQPSSTETRDAQAIGLAALGWILGEEDRAQRLLSLTGMTPDVLRAGLQDRAVLAAVLEFLTSYEPDLVKAAEELDIAPEQIAAAAQELAQ